MNTAAHATQGAIKPIKRNAMPAEAGVTVSQRLDSGEVVIVIQRPDLLTEAEIADLLRRTDAEIRRAALITENLASRKASTSPAPQA